MAAPDSYGIECCILQQPTFHTNSTTALQSLTAVNELEYCKTLKSKLSQDRDTMTDNWHQMNYAQEVIIQVI